ncbi:MAG: hypothetical protein E5Y16_07550 [Mesorhizobium sp.]|nr:MAG: hypothetical protein EOS08_16150 [Mesorhizobium sp.]TJV43703.1 MAG: hypothetical protein E5Y16_07550 [Mesorhizobium sp.]
MPVNFGSDERFLHSLTVSANVSLPCPDREHLSQIIIATSVAVGFADAVISFNTVTRRRAAAAVT